jgi:hypothetical protein
MPQRNAPPTPDDVEAITGRWPALRDELDELRSAISRMFLGRSRAVLRARCMVEDIDRLREVQRRREQVTGNVVGIPSTRTG